MPVSFEHLCDIVGKDLAEKLKKLSIDLYTIAAEHALKSGIIIADTKFEFGMDDNGNLVIADEVLTPDSSRFWPADSYKPGANPPSLDKQYVRDWLDEIGFNHQPPAPELPKEVVMKTREKYLSAHLMTSESLMISGLVPTMVISFSLLIVHPPVAVLSEPAHNMYPVCFRQTVRWPT